MNLTAFVKGNAVMLASLVLAMLSFILIPPSSHTLDLIDFDVILILFTLMAAVAGMTRCGLFSVIAEKIVSRGESARSVCAALVMLPFVTSMLITNDVALITFVPLAAAVLSGAGRKDLLIPVLVLQTVAANLGSCLTPIGNPQNLFIFSFYSPDLWEFLTTMLPVTLIGAALVLAGVLISCKGGISHDVTGERGMDHKLTLCVMVVVFICGTASVAGMVPSWIAAMVAAAAMIVTDRNLFGSIDYGLLLTFLFLFIFTGNIAQVPEVSLMLNDLMSFDPVLASAGASQVISNVPAAVMLSQFTTDWQGLLLGVSIGGLGTPIASMASLITIRMHSRLDRGKSGEFMRTFLMVNIAFLILLLSIQYLLY